MAPDSFPADRALLAVLIAAVFLWFSPLREPSGVSAELWVLIVGLVVMIGVAGAIGGRYLNNSD